MEKTVTAREANQNFSRLLAEVEKGTEIVITKRGKAVARITPLQGQRRVLTAAQKAAIANLRAASEQGFRPKTRWKFNRDELYERD